MTIDYKVENRRKKERRKEERRLEEKKYEDRGIEERRLEDRRKEERRKTWKLNCWEYHKCSRYEKCPVYSETSVDGINDGINGGRCCWMIRDTLCLGRKQGSPSSKYETCITCGFYNIVLVEQTKEGKLEDNSKIEEILKNKDKKK